MNEMIRQIEKIGIVPVVVLDEAEKAVDTARALREGGIDCAEVTFRTEAAAESIERITDAFPDMIVGAGTVLTCQQVDRAVAAGAKFIVTPGYNPRVVNYCIEKNLPVVPGCMDTASIERALEAGLDTVKFFPAEAAGGLPMLKALSGPYGNLKFMPTGGVNEKNLTEYLSFSKVVACGGSWMVKPALIKENRFEEITQLTRDAVGKMLDFEVMHVGINCENEEDARRTADRFTSLFGFSQREGTSSIFAGRGIEVTKRRFPGTCGHIAVGTASVERAVYYLQRQGVKFAMDTGKYENGKLKAIYLEEEPGGFAVHLVQK